MRFLGVAVVVLLAVAMAQAVTQDFGVTKDSSADRYGPNQGYGGVQQARGAKASWREDMSFYAFDNAAISAFIAANGGVANVQSVQFFLKPATWGGLTSGTEPNFTTGGMQLRTLISGTDWAEGNGDGSDFGWSADMAEATYTYAKCYWTLNASDNAVVDTARSVLWSKADGTPYPATRSDDSVGGLRTMFMDGNEGFANSAEWTPTSAELQYYGVALDTAFWQDMLTNSNNRGIILYDIHGVDPDGTNWRNWEANMRESGNGAYLQVTMVPEPATMALLALSGLLIVRRRRA